MKVHIGAYPRGNKERKISVRIDKYDTWDMYSTLGVIILPMLKQLQETKHGSAIVDLEDVPEHLRGHGTSQNEDTQLHLDFGEEEKEAFESAAWQALHDRWGWIMGEMIWAFEQIQPDYDWEAQYHSGVIDMDFVEIPGTEYSQMVYGPNNTHVWDREGAMKHQDRMDNGFRLFGKYYQGLWD
jgi:hypothetical protein